MSLSINIVNAQITKAIMQGEADFLVALTIHITDSYDHIVFSSPIFTGWYASNHRISIRRGGSLVAGSEPPKLFPSAKPRVTTKDMWVGNIGAAREEELAKLDLIEIGDTVRISTAIPYADEIEQNHSVYTGAEHLFDI